VVIKEENNSAKIKNKKEPKVIDPVQEET